MPTPTPIPNPKDRSEISGIGPGNGRAHGRVPNPDPVGPTWHGDEDEALVQDAHHRGPDREPAIVAIVPRGLPVRQGVAPVNQIRAGSRERMLEELARRVARRGFRIAYDLLKSREQAEDAVQEALARACEQAGKIREPGAMDGWFYRVLTNLCLRNLRRRRVRRFFLGERAVQDENHATPAASERPTDLEVAHSREVERLLVALEHVPGKQRIALLLRYGHDLSIAEIADMLGVRQATVKTHLVRGLARLRKTMES